MVTANPSSELLTDHLTVGYPSNILFENLNLELTAGKLVCLMGPNGIGKSTLIRTLAGLQKPLSGKISQIDEKRIALVLTDKIVATNMTVYDLVSYGRYPHLTWEISFTEQDHKIVAQSIGEVHIESLATKKLDELSDGQLQLTLIARALAQETPILLLDEPTAHLDLNNRVEVMRLLLNLARKKNKAIIVSTHELDLALQMADSIWLASSNKKIKTGIPESLVLDGSFDEIFQFKGFNLKTGKIQHQAYRKNSVWLSGSGYEFLWTKNALEREGYLVKDESEIKISIQHVGENLVWKNNDLSFVTLPELLDWLNKN
ncbi:MAG TPA: ABC transporter ATP-binding protein [Cytophagales bacterium]|jgi:iron complex transport system ATP-binding protein|nr:ABC transporter ATP-binding protein [Cytophagales bacterium]